MWLGRGTLYVEHGTLRFRTGGFEELAAGDYGIPFQNISALLLGPGTTVSHDALRLLARHGTGAVMIAEGGVRLYASMPFGPDASALARRQAASWASPEARIRVARRMYAWRLSEVVPSDDLAVLRGIEGARAKASYRMLGEAFGIAWRGRRYDRSNPEGDDAPNQAINHASTAVVAGAQVAVAVVGAIPQLGFIHEDSGISFALDIADLFRDTVTVPAAFAAAKRLEHEPDASIEREVRRAVGQRLHKDKVIAAMIDRIKELFPCP